MRITNRFQTSNENLGAIKVLHGIYLYFIYGCAHLLKKTLENKCTCAAGIIWLRIVQWKLI